MNAISLVPGGQYYAGTSLPFFVSHAMIDGWLIGKGFQQIVWHAKTESLPWNVVPTKDPDYESDWDEWVSAEYAGAAKVISPPAKPSWLIVILPSTTSATAGQAAQQAAADAARWAAAQAAAEALARKTSTAVTQTGKPLAAPAGGTSGSGLAVVAFVALVGGSLAWLLLRRKTRP